LTFSVFGYGSLVNRATLPDHVSAHPATVRGWRRGWRAASRSAAWGVCAVSIAEAPGAEIDGLVVTFDDAVWPVIEAREHRYHWFVLPGFERRVITFRAEPAADRFGDREHPIHMTYVETVLQGFIKEFGEAGARRFMTSTDGWHVPVLDDRAAPRYPRAQTLPAEERAFVDALLAEAGATIIRLDDTPPA
jgi:hypothetical protein